MCQVVLVSSNVRWLRILARHFAVRSRSMSSVAGQRFLRMIARSLSNLPTISRSAPWLVGW